MPRTAVSAVRHPGLWLYSRTSDLLAVLTQPATSILAALEGRADNAAEDGPTVSDAGLVVAASLPGGPCERGRYAAPARRGSPGAA